jgi:hypothetical protein
MRKILPAILLVALPAAAQVLTTEVWVGPLDMREGRFLVGEMKNISNHPGYDNQPSFFADGKSLVFSSEADSVAETGLGIQAVRYDLNTGKTTKLTKVRGFSPTPTPDGKSIMTLREGTVWQYDLGGGKSRALLPDVKTAGYFTRMDEERWILFMNEEQRHIAIWDGKALHRIVPNAITAPYRIPGQRAVTFVVQEGDAKKLMRLENDRGSVLATIPFKTGGHHVWTSRGTLLMASGNTIHEWNPAKPDDWPVVHRFSERDLQGITRIALSPSEDRIAIVSVPNDEVVLREARDASNEGFGRSYVRTIDSLAIDGDRATERGRWVRRWGTTTMPGEYAITWKRTISGSGTPVWSIETERYASTPSTPSLIKSLVISD